MPHDLTIDSNGNTEFAYTGATPWHTLGINLGDQPTTYGDFISATGLDYEVVSEPVFDRHGEIIPGQQVIRRQDTQEIFKILSHRYEIVQNTEAWGFLDTVLGSGGANYHTAGSLRGGRVMWVLAKRPGSAEIVPGDTMENYLLLTTSHDGSLALQMQTTPIRVVCGNTLTAALNRGKDKVSIKHTSSVHNQIKDAENALLQGDETFRTIVNVSKTLVDTPINSSNLDIFIESLLNTDSQSRAWTSPVKRGKLSTVNHAKDNIAEQIKQLFSEGRGQDNPRVRGTAWAAYNAVTEYVDYYSSVQKILNSQGSDEAQDRRLHRSWYGRGQTTRNRAMNLLLNYRERGTLGLQSPDKSLIGVK